MKLKFFITLTFFFNSVYFLGVEDKQGNSKDQFINDKNPGNLVLASNSNVTSNKKTREMTEFQKNLIKNMFAPSKPKKVHSEKMMQEQSINIIQQKAKPDMNSKKEESKQDVCIITNDEGTFIFTKGQNLSKLSPIRVETPETILSNDEQERINKIFSHIDSRFKSSFPDILANIDYGIDKTFNKNNSFQTRFKQAIQDAKDRIKFFLLLDSSKEIEAEKKTALFLDQITVQKDSFLRYSDSLSLQLMDIIKEIDKGVKNAQDKYIDKYIEKFIESKNTIDPNQLKPILENRLKEFFLKKRKEIGKDIYADFETSIKKIFKEYVDKRKDTKIFLPIKNYDYSIANSVEIINSEIEDLQEKIKEIENKQNEYKINFINEEYKIFFQSIKDIINKKDKAIKDQDIKYKDTFKFFNILEEFDAILDKYDDEHETKIENYMKEKSDDNIYTSFTNQINKINNIINRLKAKKIEIEEANEAQRIEMEKIKEKQKKLNAKKRAKAKNKKKINQLNLAGQDEDNTQINTTEQNQDIEQTINQLNTSEQNEDIEQKIDQLNITEQNEDIGINIQLNNTEQNKKKLIEIDDGMTVIDEELGDEDYRSDMEKDDDTIHQDETYFEQNISEEPTQDIEEDISIKKKEISRLDIRKLLKTSKLNEDGETFRRNRSRNEDSQTQKRNTSGSSHSKIRRDGINFNVQIYHSYAKEKPQKKKNMETALINMDSEEVRQFKDYMKTKDISLNGITPTKFLDELKNFRLFNNYINKKETNLEKMKTTELDEIEKFSKQSEDSQFSLINQKQEFQGKDGSQDGYVSEEEKKTTNVKLSTIKKPQENTKKSAKKHKKK